MKTSIRLMFLIRGTVKPEIIIQVLTLPILMKLKSFKMKTNFSFFILPTTTRSDNPNIVQLEMNFTTAASHFFTIRKKHM